MKKVLTLFLALTLILPMAVSFGGAVEASDSKAADEIQKGTAVIDGELDEAYLSSYKFVIDNDEVNYTWGGAKMQPYDGAYCCLIWDDDYLYLYAVNNDNTPFSNDATIEYKVEKCIWENDGPEFWFAGVENRKGLFKLSAFVDGTVFTGDGVANFEYTEVKHFGKWTDTGWVVEVAVPYPYLFADHEFSFGFQVNNILDPKGTSGSASAEHRIVKLVDAEAALNGDPSDWAREEIVKALMADLVPNHVNGNYTTDITRSDFCDLIVKMIEKKAGKSISDVIAGYENAKTDVSFNDTTNPNVIAAAKLGIVNGRSEGVFDPTAGITRQEAAKILAVASKVLGADITAKEVAFSDADSIHGWAKEFVYYVNTVGIMNGTSSTTPPSFSPLGTYTREQSILTVYRLFNSLSK